MFHTNGSLYACSHCLDLKRSGGSLSHANGHSYAWFHLFRAETKWNKLVECEWTLLRVVPNVCGWNKVKQSLLHTIGHRYAWFTLFGTGKGEEACYMRMDTVTRGSQRFELEQSGTSLLHANGQFYAWFTLFGAETKWWK